MNAALPLIDARAGYYRDIRIAINLTLSDFGSLLGAHQATVSRWENGKRRPNKHQEALLAAFQQAVDRGDRIRPDLDFVIANAGPTYALYLLLHAAHGSHLAAT